MTKEELIKHPVFDGIKLHIRAKFLNKYFEGKTKYEMFEKFALEKAKTRERYGAKSIAEMMRWNTPTKESDKKVFKVPNDHIAMFARLFILRNPEYSDFFRTSRRNNE